MGLGGPISSLHPTPLHPTPPHQVTVFRGVAGGVLPPSFLSANSMGVAGGVEAAFMSTTTDIDVAKNFATRNGNIESDQASMLFVIRMGMIDRGADVEWVSQFPTESEIVFAPLTGLEVVSHPKLDDQRKTIIVELRLSCNLKDKTMEEVRANDLLLIPCPLLLATSLSLFSPYTLRYLLLATCYLPLAAC